MAVEAITWGSFSLTDADDGDTYNMGCQFTVSEAAPCPGLRWARVPDAIEAPAGGQHFAALWTLGPDVRVRLQPFTPVPGAVDQDILWDDADGPYALAPGTSYVACILTVHYVFGASGFPVATPSGIATATVGKLTIGGDEDTIAGGTFNSRYGIGPLLGTVDDDEQNVQLTVTLPALDAAAAVNAALAVTWAPMLPALDATFTDADADDAVMGLAAVMDEIAQVLAGLPALRVHAYPPDSITPPAAIVSYPETIQYHGTYGRGLESLESLEIWIVAGPVTKRSTRNTLSGWVTGPDSVKVALENHTWTTCHTVVASRCVFDTVTYAAVDYLAAGIMVNITGIGAD